MEGETALGRPEVSENQNSSLERCIAILKTARSDNERFAALLLVTQLVHSESVDGSGRRRLFDAVGFTFINRLLNTTNVPSDCPQDVYRSLAVTILACFATDEQLLFHPQMIAKIPFLIDAIMKSEEDGAIHGDCCQILATLASTSKGCSYLMQQEAVPGLCQVISKNLYHSDAAVDVLLRMQHFNAREMWEEKGDSLMDVLSVLSSRFKESQDCSKFKLCKTLGLFLGSAHKAAIRRTEQGQWLKDIYFGVKDILQSKVTSEQRDPAIILVSVIVELVGMQWMIDIAESGSPGLFVLCITIASIETRMILDGKATEEVLPQALLLSSCYNILEKAIGFVLESTSSPSSLEDDRTLPDLITSSLPKVYNVATEAILSIIQYLKSVAHMQDITAMAKEERQVLFASVRVLCAWMAEETSALQEDIRLLLPFLMKLGRESLCATKGTSLTTVEGTSAGDDSKLAGCVSDMNVDDTTSERSLDECDLLRFLLPPLCHLSADEKSRQILIDQEGHVLLSKYFFIQWEKWMEPGKTNSNMLEIKTSLITLLGIFLNFAVMEPELVKSNKVFQDIGQHAMLQVPGLIASGKQVILLANLVVLGLMFTRQHSEKRDLQQSPNVSAFLKAAIRFLREARNVVPCNEQSQGKEFGLACREAWLDISDLWFLGTQVLMALMDSLSILTDLLKESGWINEIVNFVSDSAQEQELTTDEKGSLLNLARKVQDL